MIKDDEYQAILDADLDHIKNGKRFKYIIKKWTKKGWYNGTFTEEFHRIRVLAINRNKLIDDWDRRIVTVVFKFKGWSQPPSVGIIEYHGDNGWYFYTVHSCFWLGDYPLDDIAYIDLHPDPANIWRKINYSYWKKDKTQDRFHQKITTMTPGTVCDYSRVKEGIFIYSHPDGKIGDCLPCCQCRFIHNASTRRCLTLP